MHFLNIEEPDNTNTDTEKLENEYAIGIDLGTTNSLVAISHDRKPFVIPDVLGYKSVPSAIALINDSFVFGHEALKQKQVLRSFKRIMGYAVQDIDKLSSYTHNKLLKLGDSIAITLNEYESISAIEASAEILKLLKLQAERYLNKEIRKAVITVPAYFTETARNATRDAAYLAGLEVLRMLNEPTAAALAYSLDMKDPGMYLIYDLGGGTFDITLLSMDRGILHVRASGGDALLGGDDMDVALAKYIMDQMSIKLDYDEYNLLLIEVRKIREYLSNNEQVEFEWCNQTIEITNDKLHDIIKPFVEKTLHITASLLKDAGYKIEQIKSIILVGGATRTPLISDMLSKKFSCPILCDINPDEVVAIGAAVQAENLTIGSSDLLIDVTPLSIGIEIMGGMTEKIIQRNSTIPTKVVQEYTTYVDGQTGMKFHLVQGEREMANDCRSLAHFELKNIPPMKAGMAKVAVTFTLDLDGILTVEAVEQTTGISQSIVVKPSYGIDQSAIESMLMDSIEYGERDMLERLIAKDKSAAQQFLYSVESELEGFGYLLNDKEKHQISSKSKKLKKTLESNNRENINTAMKNLEKAVEPLISKKLNIVLKDTLCGMSIEEAKKKFD